MDGTAAAGETEQERPRLRVIEILRQYVDEFAWRYRRQAVPQVQSVLGKIALCRTAVLKGHKYRCPQCHHEIPVYNSCADRSCPQCSGARRADWLDKTAELLLPGVDYFQTVFTLPDVISHLAISYRREICDLLFRAAAEVLQKVLRDEQGLNAAALMVLHT